MADALKHLTGNKKIRKEGKFCEEINQTYRKCVIFLSMVCYEILFKLLVYSVILYGRQNYFI